jgi:hypothetical protein
MTDGGTAPVDWSLRGVWGVMGVGGRSGSDECVEDGV